MRKKAQDQDCPNIGGHLKAHENPPAIIRFTDTKYREFLEMLAKPPKPTAALKRLMAGP